MHLDEALWKMISNTISALLFARLDTTISEDHQTTTHSYLADLGSGPVRRQVSWRRANKPLGAGGMGMVYWEDCVKGDMLGSVRAVKIIAKPHMQSSRELNFASELRAMAQFSQPQVHVRAGPFAESRADCCIV
jgi:hypothetical protein